MITDQEARRQAEILGVPGDYRAAYHEPLRHTKKCKHCGEQYTAVRFNQKYCKTRCRVAAWRKAHPETRQPATAEQTAYQAQYPDSQPPLLADLTVEIPPYVSARDPNFTDAINRIQIVILESPNADVVLLVKRQRRPNQYDQGA